MKTLIVTLMLFLLKGWEVHARPVQSEAPGSSGVRDTSIESVNFPNNVTEILQQRIEAFGRQMEEQVSELKDMMASMFAQFNAEDHGTKRPASSIIQQLEALKTDISQWAVNASAIFPDNVQEDFNQKMEQFQQMFTPLISTVRGTLMEGVGSLRESVAPGIREIKKLITESESATREVEGTS